MDPWSGPKAGTDKKILVCFNVPATAENTRALLDDLAQPLAWESEIHSLRLWVYTDTGLPYIETEIEVTADMPITAELTLPTDVLGRNINFIAVANSSLPSGLSFHSLVQYRLTASGSWHEATTAELISGQTVTDGLIMSARSEVYISSDSKTTAVTLELQRIVAKIALEISVTKYPSKLAGSSIEFQKATIRNVPLNNSLFYPDFRLPQKSDFESRDLTHIEQDGRYGVLFYVFAPQGSVPSSLLELELHCILDADGNPATTDDRIAYNYTTDIAPNGQTVGKNRVYKSLINIRGMTSFSWVATTFQESDWELQDIKQIVIGE